MHERRKRRRRQAFKSKKNALMMSALFVAVLLVLVPLVDAGKSQLAPAPPATPPQRTGAQAMPPQPSPTTSPFPTIGRTRSKRYCTLEIDRTNGAITVTLTNDRIIAAGIARLRSADLDRQSLTIIDRERAMHDLRSVAAAIQKNLRAGDAQLADLRALSIKEPDATRSPELKLLADRLDDAMTEQRTVGSDLAKMLTIVDGRYAAAQGTLTASGAMPETNAEHVGNGLVSIDERAAHEPLNQLFNEVADEFGDRAAIVGKSEDAAAAHTRNATSGC